MSKKQDILDAALRLSVQAGFEATATALIAKEAGVATGTLFHHFENKEALINELYLVIKRDITTTLVRSLEGTDDLRERGERLFVAFIDWARDNPERFRFNSIFCHSPAITKRSRRLVVEEVTSEVTRVFLEEGYAKGLLRDLPLPMHYAFSSTLMVESARYFLEHPEARKDRALVGRTFESFWHALTVPDTGATQGAPR